MGRGFDPRRLEIKYNPALLVCGDCGESVVARFEHEPGVRNGRPVLQENVVMVISDVPGERRMYTAHADCGPARPGGSRRRGDDVV